MIKMESSTSHAQYKIEG